MNLREKLEEISEAGKERIPESAREKMHRATRELADSGLVEKAVGAGDKIPSFSLPNISGEERSSDDLLREGGLVLTFYRGDW
ncbi:MAG: hypothetical protein DWQ47_06100 [Acidobacteria bacterium]|nr:MAG: hypothetical protein DWQ32_09650 [Acidobacteriota bacterium]REK01950.1 MAG: hypothetical protein DWQ38_06085 [Acidobacteriota bacterium]REK14906.1 MAG: hypothetical protein DWQ43_15340 [Acidobacteriota bacterium]REK45621.1 MAG: hypothetical protein DWQ47_06100 [Acidobacteriota bacterium]